MEKDQLVPRAGATAEGRWISKTELERLQATLQEAQETLDAIRNGEVDAVVVSGDNGSQIYSLSGAEHPYRIYVEQMQEGAVTLGEGGLILYSNQRFAEMLNQPLERVISSDIRRHLPESAWEKISSVLHDQSNVAKHESVLVRDDGVKIPAHFTASPLPLPDQSVICLVITDLSQQKAKEELRLGKEVAERANIAKDAFLATLSHELRTPLTPSLLAIAVLQQDTTLPANVQSMLAVIRRNLELETRLIDDLLDLTRIANGKLELQEEPIDVHSVLSRAIDVCRPSFEAKRQKVALHLDAKTTSMQGDAVRLEQAFWNIINNAIKFTSAEGAITISSANIGAGKLLVTITDSGIGFEPSLAQQMFQAFEQSGRNITRHFGGLGLGLSISRSIVTAHGGRIWAESPGVNQGASFYIEFPLRRSAPSNPRRDAKLSPEGTGDGFNILLVEDHEDTRNILEMTLQAKGHAIVTATSAAHAIEIARDHRFDLVLSDLGLPDNSGLELMSALRDTHGLCGIAISGYGMEEDVLRSREAGFAAHLTKPIDPAELENRIREVGEKKKTRRGNS